MAGGPNAATVPCMECLMEGTIIPARRVREGVEADQFRCERGHDFGMDFPRGVAEAPMWPPSSDFLNFAASRRQP